MKRLHVLLLLVAVGFVSCDSQDSTTDEHALTSSVNSEVIIEDVENVLDNVSIYSDTSFGVGTTSKTTASSKESSVVDKRGRSGFFKDCANITVEIAGGIITTSITFTGECEDFDGNVITGTITIVKAILDTSKERTITFDNLTINGYVVNGTKTYTYTSENSNGNPQLTSSINISVETESGTFSKVGNRTIEITAGGDTYSCADDEKTITGSSTFNHKNGSTFSVEITQPLVIPIGCRYIASGIKVYTIETGTIVVDYGDGTCDNIATKTGIDGSITEITLRKKRHH